jgi:hypothetical protein
VNNPCQSYQQTNYMGSFRNRNLIYITGSGAGPTLQITGQYFSLFSDGTSLNGTTAIQGGSYFTTGTIRCQGGLFLGSGGAGGAGSTVQVLYGVHDPAQPGGGGRAGLEFQGEYLSSIRVQAGTFYGGGGGGGGGAGGIYAHDDPYYRIGYAGGGGGGGANSGPGGAGGGGDGDHRGYPGQNAGYGAGAGGQGAPFGYYQAGGQGGSGGQYGQPGQSGQVMYLDNPTSAGAGGGTAPGVQGVYSVYYY